MADRKKHFIEIEYENIYGDKMTMISRLINDKKRDKMMAYYKMTKTPVRFFTIGVYNHSCQSIKVRSSYGSRFAKLA